MDPQTKSFPRRDIRVSDAERDQAIAELSEHFQAGRLTQEEFEDRSGRALRARTVSDLSGLFTDLPRAAVPAPGAAGAAGPAFARGGMDRAGYLPLVPIVISLLVVAIAAGNVYGGPYRSHGSFSFLILVIVVVFFILRLARRR